MLLVFFGDGIVFDVGRGCEEFSFDVFVVWVV